MNKKFFTAAAVFCAGMFLAADNPEMLKWDFSQPQRDWQKCKDLTVTQQNDALELNITGRDSNLLGEGMAVDPVKYTRIRITYSAEGLPDKTSGEIFYAGKRTPNFTGRHCFRVPSLIADGKEHTLTLDARRDIPAQAEDWFKEGSITKLRLDLVNEFPGKILLKKIEFLPDPATKTSWDFTLGDDDWSKPKAMVMELKADGMHMNIHAFDSSVENSYVNFSPADFPRIRVTYSAEGFDGPTHGEIFFIGDDMKQYNGKYCFTLKTITADGRDRVIEVDANKDIAAGKDFWFNLKKITKLRLDLVNQFPGRIIVKKIELLPPAKPEITSIHESNLTSGWIWPVNGDVVDVTLPAGRFNVWLLAADSPAQAVKAFKDVEYLEIADEPVVTEAGVKVGVLNLMQRSRVKMNPPLTAKNLLITAEDTFPEYRPENLPAKVVNEMSAKPFRGQLIQTDPNQPYWQSKMIAGQDWYKSATFSVRRTFDLKAKPVRGNLQIVADDQVEAVYINGQPIPVKWTRDWHYPSVVDVTGYLRPGKNILAVRYTNHANLGGLMYDLTVNFADRSDWVVCGDGSERITAAEISRWYAEKLDDSSWDKPDTRPGPPHDPWTTVLPYCNTLSIKGSVSASGKVPDMVKNIDEMVLNLTLRGTPAITDDEVVYANLYPQNRTANTQPTATISGKISDLLAKRNADGSISLTLKGFDLPRWGGEYKGILEYGIYQRQSEGKNTFEFTLAPRPYPGHQLIVRNDAKKGSPTIMVNDKPFYPIQFDVYYERSDDGMSGSESPINVRTFLAGGMAVNWWIGPDQYDFSALDKHISMLIEKYPTAYLSAKVWCQPNHWYDKVYPGRISKQSDGENFPYYVSPVTFSDKDYQADAKKALRAFVEHCEKYFGPRMFSYTLAGGISLEWQAWGCHNQDKRKVLNDYSSAAQRDFKAYAAKYYPHLKITGVPSYAERTAPGETIFRDPVKEAASIVVDEYLSHSIADCILALAEEVKKACQNNSLVGVYYGYYFEYANMAPCTNGAGHNASWKVVRSPYIDYLMSPPSYGVRYIGDPGADMKFFGSLRQAGKFSYIEDDTRTHLIPTANLAQTITEEQTANILRRNFGMQISRRNPLDMLTIIDGREFNSPQIRSDLKKLHKIGQDIYESNVPSGVEMAVVADETAVKYMRSITKLDFNTNYPQQHYDYDGNLFRRSRPAQNILGELAGLQRIPLGQVGCGVDFLYLEDVPELADKYKFWVFLGNFEASDKLRSALRALKDKNVTVMVVYGAGFAGTDKPVNTESMSDLLGMQIKRIDKGSLKVNVNDLSLSGSSDLLQLCFGGDDVVNPRFAVTDAKAQILGHYADGSGAALAVKQQGKMKTVFFGGVRLTPDMLRMFARDAGVFINHDGNDGYFAGFGVHTIYSMREGKKILKFPQAGKVIDVISGEVLAENSNTVTLDMKAFETRIVYVK